MIIIKIRFSSVLVFWKKPDKNLAVLIWEAWQSLGLRYHSERILLNLGWLPPQWKNVKRVCLIIWGQTWSWPRAGIWNITVCYIHIITYIIQGAGHILLTQNWSSSKNQTTHFCLVLKNISSLARISFPHTALQWFWRGIIKKGVAQSVILEFY